MTETWVCWRCNYRNKPTDLICANCAWIRTANGD